MCHANDMDIRQRSRPPRFQTESGVSGSWFLATRSPAARAVQQTTHCSMIPRLAVVVENIADQQHVVRIVGFRRVQHHPQAGGAVVAIGSLVRIGIDMKVGTVHKHDICGARSLIQSIGVAHQTGAARARQPPLAQIAALRLRIPGNETAREPDAMIDLHYWPTPTARRSRSCWKRPRSPTTSSR